MGQNGRALLLVMCATAGVAGVAGCGTPPLAEASTVLRSAHDAVVVHPDGSRSAADAGGTLQRGDEVVTGRDGSATLETRDRSVFVVADSAVRVADGAHQAVQRGSMIVDARTGDGEAVAVDGFAVAVPAGSVGRVDAGVSPRVAALAGSSRVLAPGGAALTVPGLSQVQLGGDTLPAAASVLHLTDDAAEAAAVPGLVRDDEVLNDLARGLDGSGALAARTVTAAFATGARTSARLDISDRVLPVVLSRAARGPAPAGYAAAVRWRAQGGSWGVIAHRLGVSAGAAADELTALEQQPPGSVARTIAAALVTTAGVRTANGGGGGDAAGSGTGRRRTGGPGTTPPSSGGGGTPAPAPPPSPSPTAPVRKLVSSVDGTVRKVLKALPPPLPHSTVSVSLGPVHVKVG